MSEPAQPIPVTTSAGRVGVPGRRDAAPDPLASGANHAARGPRRSPWVDIHETPEGLILEADVPGASERSLTIHLDQSVLSLRAGVEPAVTSAARLIQQEYPPGDFERSFILSDDIDRARIVAELRCGVLRIWLPRADRYRTRLIEVRAE